MARRARHSIHGNPAIHTLYFHAAIHHEPTVKQKLQNRGSPVLSIINLRYSYHFPIDFSYQEMSFSEIRQHKSVHQRSNDSPSLIQIRKEIRKVLIMLISPGCNFHGLFQLFAIQYTKLNFH